MDGVQRARCSPGAAAALGVLRRCRKTARQYGEILVYYATTYSTDFLEKDIKD
jgi:hypothetical protein